MKSYIGQQFQRIGAVIAVVATLGFPSSAGAESPGDVGQIRSMLRDLQNRVSALEEENRKVRKEAADARAEAKRLREAGRTKSNLSPASPEAKTRSTSATGAFARANDVVPITRAQDRSRFFVGADLLYVQPRFSSNPAFIRAPDQPGNGGPTTLTSFSHAATATALLTAGFEAASGVGVRGRYWWLDSDSDRFLVRVAPDDPIGLSVPRNLLASGVNTGGIPSDHTFNLGSALHLRTADIESTWRTRSGPWTVNLAAGARYASVGQSMDVSQHRIPVDVTRATSFTTLATSQKFEGVGPTAAIETKYALGWQGFSVYGSGRGSLIFGTRREQATLTHTLVFPAAPTTTVLTTENASVQTMVPIIEMEAGLHWSYAIGNIEALFGASVVSQMWFNAGNAINNSGINNGSLSSSNANLGLIGGRLSGTARF